MITSMYFLKLIVSLVLLTPYAYSSDFPVIGEMRNRVDFWKKVYTEISTKEAFIHDTQDLTVIYKKVALPKNRRERVRSTKNEKKRIARILNSIAKKDYKNLTSDENKIAQIIGKRSPQEIKEMSKNIRSQYGLKDRYYNGLIRSYKYLDFIKRTFKNLSLPNELVYLPHVESSFNYNAYSKVGAAGIWQFMRSTGRIYGLKVSYIIDERRDPLKATKAAARLLRDNYEKLQSWPLALTAYNHGTKSIERAVTKLKTKDINKIIEGYEGRRFGFASKNFYATFMATVEISKDPKKYFKSFTPPEIFKYSTLSLDRPYTISDITKALKINQSTLRQYNHAIRPIAFRSDVYLPKGFELKLPVISQKKEKDFQVALSKFSTDYEKQDVVQTHIITSGESLYYLSKIYKVDLNKLIRYNQISNPSQIYPGMRIKIPGKKKSIQLANIDKKPKIAPLKKKVETRVVSIAKKLDQSQKNEILNSTDLKVDNLSSYKLETKKINNSIYQIFIESEETLGHYAEWANIRTQSIREVNDLSFRSNIKFGQKLLIPIDEDKLINFKQSRAQFHLGIQEDFYNNYKVVGKTIYRIKRGDTLNAILRKFSAPMWLIRSFEGNNLSSNLMVGQTVSIPKIEGLQEDSTLYPEDSEQDS